MNIKTTREVLQFLSFILLGLGLGVASSAPAQWAVVSLRQSQLQPPVPAKLVLGLPGFPGDADGFLVLSPTTLRFGTAASHVDIQRRRILAVSSGDERVETGGTAGRVARMMIPYGGGLALGAVTHKKVSLLTVEYLDVSGEYHGAVFLAGQHEVDSLNEQIMLSLGSNVTSVAANPRCAGRSEIETDTIQLQPIDSDVHSAFPPEDRALLYENLLRRLQSEKTITTVYRAGDASAGASCAEFRVTVKAMVFQKGDQAVRASVGPLGHFIGTTRLQYHLTITNQDGMAIVDRDLKASEGSDTDSLNITKVISKAVVKNVKRSRTQARISETAS